MRMSATTQKTARDTAPARGRGGEPSPAPERPRPSRHALHEEAASALRDMIMEGVLRGGDRVPEEPFCRRLGISRTPLREALKILAAEGLVELRPNRGSIVTVVPADEVEAIFEVMAALEELTGTLLCARISNEEIEQILSLHEEMARAFRGGKRARYFALNQDIHRQLVRAAKNPVLAASYAGFTERIQRARFQANYDPVRWEESMREHEDIMQALEGRRPKELARLLREHSDHTGQAVVAHLRAAARGPRAA